MKDKTLSELGNLLALETINVSNMEMEQKQVHVVDKEKWAWMAMGFSIALKLDGFSDKEVMEVIEKSQETLNKIETQ